MYLKAGNWNGKQIITSDWINASVTPSASVTRLIKYGYKWWLIPYGTDDTKYAWCCRGFGDQSAIIIPEFDIVAVFTGWNIIENGPSLDSSEPIRRIVSAVLDK